MEGVDLRRDKELAFHKCDLKTGSRSGLSRLRPQAGKIRRFIRSIRKIILVNSKNPTCYQVLRSNAAVLHESRRHIRSPHWFIIHPFSKLAMAIEIIMAVTWIFVFFKDPATIVFLPANRIITNPLYNVIVRTSDIIVAFFCCSRFLTGKENIIKLWYT